MSGALDVPVGILFIIMFIWILENFQTLTGVTPGEQAIILVIAGYGALYGARIAGNVLIDIAVYSVKWFGQTELGKSIAGRLNIT